MRIAIVLVLIIATACNVQKIPKKKLRQYIYEKNYTVKEGDIEVTLRNPLHCPLRVWMQSSNESLSSRFDSINPVVLPAMSDTLLVFRNVEDRNADIDFSSRLGDTSQQIIPIALELPFPKGKLYRVIQGNNSEPTHNKAYSRYAIDFGLSLQDTVCSAMDGYVVGVVEEYKYGGSGEEWRPFGNFITIYHPESGLFTQYAHLYHNGSFVQVGDTVRAGQPIGLSGMTGQTDIEHLHFNCLIPVHTENGLKSVPCVFKEGYVSEELKEGDMVEKR